MTLKVCALAPSLGPTRGIPETSRPGCFPVCIGVEERGPPVRRHTGTDVPVP